MHRNARSGEIDFTKYQALSGDDWLFVFDTSQCCVNSSAIDVVEWIIAQRRSHPQVVGVVV